MECGTGGLELGGEFSGKFSGAIRQLTLHGVVPKRDPGSAPGAIPVSTGIGICGRTDTVYSASGETKKQNRRQDVAGGEVAWEGVERADPTNRV
jgi:hypothetical protein